MKTEKITINKIVADEGYVFALKDKSEIYSNIIFLGKEDKAANYIEITIEEAEIITKELEEAVEETE